MKSAKLFVIIIMCVLLIPILLFSINCSQKENGGGAEDEQASAKVGEQAREGEGEHASRESGEHEREGERTREGEGEHASGESGEHSGEGEESGTRYTISQTCDEVRKGVQLHLKYDKSTSTFVGTIKNVSKETAKRVRVEVHLSNKVELGPTKALDLAPGKQVNVKLAAEGQSFTWWSAHAESGSSEH